MTRSYGRIIGGERVREATPGTTWDSTTIISSIRHNGKTAAMTVSGATDSIVFETYISKILSPTLCKNDIVIMDNLKAHKSANIKDAIEATGATPRYLAL